MTRRLPLLLLLLLWALPQGAAQAFEGYRIKKQTLDILEARQNWETKGKHDLDQAWKELQDAVGPLQLELFSVAYGALWGDTRVGGRDQDGRALAGWDTRFKAHWRPWQDGQFFLQLQYNFGKKSLTPSGKGLLFSHINGIVGGLPEGKYTFHDLVFTQHFLDRRLFFAFGHTDPEAFIDENRFANSDHTQFASQVFAQEVGLDAVDERGPLFAFGFEPHETVELVALVSATTKAASDEPKNLWTRPFWDGPFVGGQVHLMPDFLGREGNYRLFAWSTLYDQPRQHADGETRNWGLGFNFDQDITDRLGVFGRLGLGNQDVGPASWDWSAGLQYTGLVPSRDTDVFGFAVGGVQAAPYTAYGGMEIHLESYYKLRLTQWLALTPMGMYVLQPRGDPGAIPVIQGMLRLEMDFKTS